MFLLFLLNISPIKKHSDFNKEECIKYKNNVSVKFVENINSCLHTLLNEKYNDDDGQLTFDVVPKDIIEKVVKITNYDKNIVEDIIDKTWNMDEDNWFDFNNNDYDDFDSDNNNNDDNDDDKNDDTKKIDNTFKNYFNSTDNCDFDEFYNLFVENKQKMSKKQKSKICLYFLYIHLWKHLIYIFSINYIVLQWIKKLPSPTAYSLSNKCCVNDEKLKSVHKLHYFGKKNGKKSKTLKQIHHFYTGLTPTKKSLQTKSKSNDKQEQEDDEELEDFDIDMNDNKTPETPSTPSTPKTQKQHDDDFKMNSAIKTIQTSPAQTRSATKVKIKNTLKSFYGCITDKKDIKKLQKRENKCNEQDVHDMKLYEVWFSFKNDL